MNYPTRYTTTAIVLHWLVAVLIGAAFVLGLVMTDMELSPEKLQYFSWHKWLGVTVFALVVVRLVWRAKHQAPPLPLQMPGWQIRVAQGLHHLLYLLMVLVPVTGYLMSCAAGVQVVYFGVLPLPMVLEKNHDLKELFEEVHELLANGMAVAVAIHVAAALKHQWIDRDKILSRMLPFLK